MYVVSNDSQMPELTFRLRIVFLVTFSPDFPLTCKGAHKLYGTKIF